MDGPQASVGHDRVGRARALSNATACPTLQPNSTPQLAGSTGNEVDPPSPMLDFALLVKEKLEPIIRSCLHPVSNGKAEGINSQPMAIQRSARGFRSHASSILAGDEVIQHAPNGSLHFDTGGAGGGGFVNCSRVGCLGNSRYFIAIIASSTVTIYRYRYGAASQVFCRRWVKVKSILGTSLNDILIPIRAVTIQ